MTVAIQTILDSIADNIERFGHYQGPTDEDEEGADCCVYVNPGWSSMYEPQVAGEIARRAGFTLTYFGGHPSLLPLFDWNDNTPTDEVLRVLRGQG